MKILILQLARFGDIYMTWPLIKALKRTHPDSQIHCLVRKRFIDALQGLDEVDHVIELPSQLWAETLIRETKSSNEDPCSFSESVGFVDQFVNQLSSQKYTKVINASFSPLSSYLTHAVVDSSTEVFGYTRFHDGSFRCSDPLSLYFYSQVGENRRNHYHVTDLLAAMVGVDLLDSDHSAPSQDFKTIHQCHPQKTILVHVGASQKKKSITGFQWGRLIKAFLEHEPNFELVLIGSPQEKIIADEVLAHAGSSRVTSMVGRTQVPQVFDLLKNAHSLIACDSMALHMASLTKTPTFNLSFKTVNFWETGPLALGSVVYQAETPATLDSSEVASKWSDFVRGRPVTGVFFTQKNIPRFHGNSTSEEEFEWNLLQALYTNEAFPITDDALFCECIEKMNQLNDLFIENLKRIQRKPLVHASLLLNQIENTLMGVGRFHSAAALLLRWYRGRKIQVPPMKESEIVKEYLKIHLEFRSILKVYLWNEENDEQTLKKD